MHRRIVSSNPFQVDIFSEEVIRMGSAASLSQLLSRLDPVLRAAADLGAWQLISPAAVAGVVRVVERLEAVQDTVYKEATILVAGRVSGEEEIPDGAVAVLTPDMPDVLSHVSVRARNGKVRATRHRATRKRGEAFAGLKMARSVRQERSR